MGTGVLEAVGVFVMVGVSDGIGVSVGGAGELVGVAESAATVRITTRVRSARVSAAPGALGTDGAVEIPQAMTASRVIAEISARRVFCVFMDPPALLFVTPLV
ncbi:MAG: hypothetical protein B6D39_03535 [Anaerolineae bacterium UTCFX2]|nr:MAG: hypothetical protein B6D39_03535 [Anaerolineae bacterium UTCFX2]